MPFVTVTVLAECDGQAVFKSVAFPSDYLSDPDKLKAFCTGTLPPVAQALLGELTPLAPPAPPLPK